MSAISRYFDSLVAPLFKKDDQGRTLFFPAGIWSKGRIIPDEATGERLRKGIRRGYMVLFGLLIPLFAIGNAFLSRGSNGWMYPIIGGLLIGLAFQAYTFTLARGLPVSDNRLSYKEAVTSQSRALGAGWLKALAIGSALFVLGSLAMTILGSGSDRLVGLAGMALFGGCLALFTWQMKMAKS